MTTPPGLPLYLDGVPYVYPRGELRPVNQLRQAEFVAGNMTSTFTAAYDGDGLPTLLDSYSFELPWELDENFSALDAALRILRTAGGVHTLALATIRESYTYALRAGQATFWLPRGDAAAQDYASAAVLPAVVTVGSSAQTVVYKNSVSPSDTPAAGEVWISRDVSAHPSGKMMAFCKLGTAPVSPSSMIATYCQLFRIVVKAIATQYPFAGVAVSTLMAQETN